MVDDALTVPCEGIGVWEGARVVTSSGRAYIVDEVVNGAASTTRGACYGLSLLSLDLTHRPTRLEAMVRLADGLGLCQAHSATWERRGPQVWAVATTWDPDADTYWCQQYSAGSDWCSSQPVRAVGALADLDPADDTRLPDGARVVDVRALAIVLRQVFTPPTPSPGYEVWSTYEAETKRLTVSMKIPIRDEPS